MKRNKRLIKISVFLCTLFLCMSGIQAQEVKKYLTTPVPGELVTGEGIEDKNNNVYWTESPDGTYGAYFHWDANVAENRTCLLLNDAPFANVDVNSGFTISLEAYLSDLSQMQNYGRFVETATYWNDDREKRQHFFAWVTGPYAHLMSEFHLYSSDYVKVDENNQYVLNENGKNVVDEENGVFMYARTSERYEGASVRQTNYHDYSSDNMWHNFMLSIKADGTQSCYVDGKVVYSGNNASAIINHLKIVHDYQFISLGNNPNGTEGMTGWMRNVQIAPTGEMGSISMDMSTDRSLLEKLTANSSPLTKTAILIPKGVEVTLAAAKGWKIDLSKVQVLDGNGIDLFNRTTGKFTMPAGTVTVKFVTDDGQGGTVDPEDLYEAKTPATATFTHSSVNVTYSPDGSYNGNTLIGKETADNTKPSTWASVSYLSSNTSVAIVDASTGAVTIKGVGRADITATVEDDDNYTYEVERVSYALNVTKAEGLINYAVTAVSKTEGEAAFTNPLTQSGDGTVTYASSNTTLAVVDASSGEVTLQSGQNGLATITATVTDGANYTYPATTASYTLRVVANGTPTNIKMADATYENVLKANGTNLTATAIQIPSTSEVRLAVAEGYRVLDWSKITASANSSSVSIDATNHTFSMPGYETTISVTDANAIKQLESATVTFGETSKTVKWGESYTQAATNSGDGSVSYASGNNSVATVDDNGVITLVGIGTTMITATATEGENNYYPTPTATYTLQVTKADASVTLQPAAQTLTYTGNSLALISAGTASTGGEMQYKLGSGSYSTAIPTARNAGTYPVMYKAVGNPADKYNDSEEGIIHVTISPASSSVSTNAEANGTLTYSGEPQNLVTAATGTGGTIVYGLGENNVNRMLETIPTAKDAGTYTVYYAVAGDDNHSDSEVSSVQVTIGPKALTVTAKPKTITYGDAPANDGVTYSEFVTGETESVLGGTLDYDYNYSQFDEVGTGAYTITPKGLTSTNYAISYEAGTLTVQKADLNSVVIADIADQTISTGASAEPAVTVTINEHAVSTDDYTIAYSDNTNAGTGTVTLTSKNKNFTESSTKTATYAILRALDVTFDGADRKWATYYAAENLVKPENMNVYTVTGVSGTSVTLSEPLDYIPQGVGVLLNYDGEKNDFTASKYTGDVSGTFDSNKLVGSTTAITDLPAGSYVLYNNEFVLANGTSLAANRCYLPAGFAITNAPKLTIFGAVTNIRPIFSDDENDVWYTLDGRKLQGKPSAKGLYIKNGKKSIIK